MDILDSLELTTAGDIEEVHTKRINYMVIVVTKLHGDFIFPVLKHGWPQPNDNHVMTRRNRVGKRLDIEYEEDEEELPTPDAERSDKSAPSSNLV